MQTSQVSNKGNNFVKRVSEGMGWTDAETFAQIISIAIRVLDEEQKREENNV